MTEKNENKAKILLVEDEPNIAKLFTYNLKRAGYDYQHAENGQIALEMAKEYSPDLIISDIMMPVVDGFEFRKNLLNDSVLSQIPFIFLTAKGSEDDVLEGYGLEIEDYIIKTSSAKIIMAKVAALLASHKKERSKAQSEVQKAADKMGAVMAPEEFPELEGFEIKHWYLPFQETPGGDFIDYFKLDENRVAVILGDVMGKRWGAFYFAVAYAGYVRSAVRLSMQSKQNMTPSEILNAVNIAVYHDDRISEVFITLSVIIVDKSTNIASYSGAGDLPIVLKKNENVELVQSNGLLLGFTDSAEYNDIDIDLNNGDIIFLYSDGIPDSRNPEGVAYGKDRFNEIASKIMEDDEPLEFIKSDFIDYTKNKYDDDVSLISIKML